MEVEKPFSSSFPLLIGCCGQGGSSGNASTVRERAETRAGERAEPTWGSQRALSSSPWAHLQGPPIHRSRDWSWHQIRTGRALSGVSIEESYDTRKGVGTRTCDILLSKTKPKPPSQPRRRNEKGNNPAPETIRRRSHDMLHWMGSEKRIQLFDHKVRLRVQKEPQAFSVFSSTGALVGAVDAVVGAAEVGSEPAALVIP